MGTKEFRQLYPICMTGKDSVKIDKQSPGFTDGIYLLDWTAIGRQGKVGVKEEKTQFDDNYVKMAPKREVTIEELAEARNPKISWKRQLKTRWQ